MNSGRTVFAQRIDHLPHKKFQKRVARCQVDQTAPADQGLLRHQRERGEDPNLGNYLLDSPTLLGYILAHGEKT
jgi:hypothetical protein